MFRETKIIVEFNVRGWYTAGEISYVYSILKSFFPPGKRLEWYLPGCYRSYLLSALLDITGGKEGGQILFVMQLTHY